METSTEFKNPIEITTVYELIEQVNSEIEEKVKLVNAQIDNETNLPRNYDLLRQYITDWETLEKFKRSVLAYFESRRAESEEE